MKTFLPAIVALVAIFTPAESKPWLKSCTGRAVDAIFVLDTSSSIRVTEFNTYVRPFVRDVIKMFDIGADRSQTRVGLVTYSTEYHPQFDLGDHLTQASLERAIETVIFTGGSTFTSKALDYVTRDMFRRENGARDDAAKVIILVTDGKSRFPRSTRDEAEAARANGVHMFAIGVGEEVDQQELRAIADDPDSEHMFQVESYQALHGIQRHLAENTCKVPQPIRPTDRPIGDKDPAIRACGGKPADVYFLLDVSSSVWEKNFNTKVLPFVQDMASIFDIGSQKTRVGLVTFSDELTMVFRLDQHRSRDQLMAALTPETVKYTGGQTYTSAALAYIRDVGFSEHASRPGVAQVIIVITDGISYDPVLTAAEAALAKRKGIYLFAVGVGPSVDYKELRDISSDPDERFVFNVTSFDALSSIRNILAIKTCTVKPPSDIALCNLDPTDIYFIFESGSKSRMTRKVFREGVVRFVKSTFLHKRDIRISAVTDPCMGDNDIPFTTLTEFKFRFGSIPVPANTKLHDLVLKMREQTLTSGETTHQVRNQVGVIFVDEATTDFRRVVMEARRAQSMGIELFVVAVGNLPSRTVDAIASSHARDHVVRLNSYSEMNSLKGLLDKKMCQ